MSHDYIDCILDFETLDFRPTSCVVDFSVVFFNSGKEYSYKELLDKVYYWKFDLNHQITTYGRTVDQNTLDWWEKQSQEAKAVLTPTTDDVSITRFIKELQEVFVKEGVSTKSLMYSRGSDFDFPILKSIAEQADRTIDIRNFPTPFWNIKDLRSVIGGYLGNPLMHTYAIPKEETPGFIKHDSRHDVAHAAYMLMKCRRPWARRLKYINT